MSDTLTIPASSSPSSGEVHRESITILGSRNVCRIEGKRWQTMVAVGQSVCRETGEAFAQGRSAWRRQARFFIGPVRIVSVREAKQRRDYCITSRSKKRPEKTTTLSVIVTAGR